MRQAPEALESIALRRARVADADKIRYRIYKTPTDFVAVIAESALMAMKAAGVKAPHKIVRDFPTEGVAIEAKRMAEIDENDEKILVNHSQKPAIKPRLVTEVKPRSAAQEVADFKAMTLGDLQRSGRNRARILSPQMLSEIIDEYSKVGSAPPPAAAVVEPVVSAAPAETATAPAQAAAQPAATVAEAPAVVAATAAPAAAPVEPQVSQEDKVMQLASEILPSAKDLPPAAPGPTLSPDEVNQLLNE